MAEEWKDIFQEQPDDAETVWVRSNCGCLAPIQVLYWAFAPNWQFWYDGSNYTDVPIWAYRMWRRL